jgi:hypothetical protein
MVIQAPTHQIDAAARPEEFQLGLRSMTADRVASNPVDIKPTTEKYD